MNLRAVGWLVGCVLLLLAGFLLVPALVSAGYYYFAGETGELAAIRATLISALLTAAIAVIATLNGAGPGLALVGPYQNFDGLPDLAKLLRNRCGKPAWIR